jgi:hypothetical protein
MVGAPDLPYPPTPSVSTNQGWTSIKSILTSPEVRATTVAAPCRVTTPTLPVQYPQCACAAAIYAAALAGSGKLVTRCRTHSGPDGPSPVISCCWVAVPSSRYDGTAPGTTPSHLRRHSLSSTTRRHLRPLPAPCRRGAHRYRTDSPRRVLRSLTKALGATRICCRYADVAGPQSARCSLAVETVREPGFSTNLVDIGSPPLFPRVSSVNRGLPRRVSNRLLSLAFGANPSRPSTLCGRR